MVRVGALADELTMENFQQPPNTIPGLGAGEPNALALQSQTSSLSPTQPQKPFYKRPLWIVLFIVIALMVLTTSFWIGYAYQTRDKASFKCQLAKPIMKVIDYRQQEYNEKCRIAFYEATVPLDMPAEYVVFEYEFHSPPGADGVATIRFDDEVIATLRESETPAGLQQATFEFPRREPGNYRLRVETVPYTDASSEFRLSNFRFGYHTYDTNAQIEQEEPNPSVRSLAEFTYNQDHSKSETGIVAYTGNDVELRTTDGPAWIYIPIQTDDWIIGMSADVDFVSQGVAEGLMAVYIDSRALGGNVDERHSINSSDNGRPRAWYIAPLEPGTYTLAFRLDAHTEVPSAITIKNIGLWTYTQEQFMQSEYYQYLQRYGTEL